MRMRGPILSLALLLTPALASAQSNPECAPYTAYAQSENLCNAAVDATHYFHPLLGLAISGGNPVVGSFRSLGGLGHLSVGIRGTVFEAGVPDLAYDGTSPTVSKGDDIPLGAPTVDVGLGLFRGLSSGLLSVDALGSFVFVPNDVENLHVDPDAPSMGNFSYRFGYGARIGILRGGFPIPTISASYMHRSVPTVTYGDVAAGDNYSYQLGLDATNLRLMAGWHILFLDVGAGIGKDTYTGDAEIKFDDPNPSDPGIKTIPISLDNSRTTLFADVGMNLLFLKIGAEVGMQTTNDLKTATDFQGIDVKEGRKYASVGVRFQF